MRLIDVVCVTRGTTTIAATFDVEHSTTIHPGVVRMIDLALSVERDTPKTLFLVARNTRSGEVATQPQRPRLLAICRIIVR